MSKTVLGIIGGSGVYDIAGLEGARWERVKSPWGEASDELHFGTLAGVDMVFLPRHGRGHVHSPTTINYRANIDALKRAGVTDVISVSACGSFREELPPGNFVIVDQFIDRTHRARENVSSAKASWRMCRWPIRSARSSRMRWWKPARTKTSNMRAAAPIWRWKARNSPRSPKAISIVRGDAR